MGNKIVHYIHKSGSIAIGTPFTCFGREVILVNPSDRDWTQGRWIFEFGAYGTTRLMVWGNGVDSAMSEAVDWLAENAPGRLYDNEVSEALAKGELEEDATADMFQSGNYGNWVASWECAQGPVNPTRAELREYLGTC